MERNVLNWITAILVIVGAINWGLVGLADLNLVSLIFGAVSWLETTVYVLVGLAGVWEGVGLFRA